MAKKSKKRRKVLAASCILAALIVAGSSFAWFTSKDEVTNRLSASANYGVAIAEDFQPPENWIPGQEINKDVGAVNTGNVDAFTRVWLEGEMSVVARTSQASSAKVSEASSNKISPVTDAKYNSIGLNYYNATNKLYYRELSQVKSSNPQHNDIGTSNESGTSENTPGRFSEVQSIQAGAYLVSVPTSANYYYVLEHNTTIAAYADISTSSKTNYELQEGDIVATKGADVPSTVSSGHTVVYLENGTTPGDIDSSQFYPQTEGTYVFRRNVVLDTTENTIDTYEYAGYYYIPVNSAGLLATADTSKDHYIALYTDTSGNSDYTLPTNAISTQAQADPSHNVTSITTNADNLKFYNAKETVVQNGALKWTYTAPSGGDPAKLTAYYAGADNTLGKTVSSGAFVGSTEADDIVVDITLANIDTGDENWTVKSSATTPVEYYAPTETNPSATATSLATNGLWTFYYNNDLEAGDTTNILVDKVTLSQNTTQFAFMAFDFDLKVKLESVQVTMNEDGKETADSVNEWDATTGNTGAKSGSLTYDSTATDEIKNVNWANHT